MQYLTESRLGEHLNTHYSFIHDKSVPNSKSRFRPDYRNDELMLIVEFDGYGHFVNNKQIINDSRKDTLYTEMGYRVIRIPYFIQLTPALLSHIFQEDISFEQEYPHGFIDKKATLPADYCERGLIKFRNMWGGIYAPYKEEVFASLKLKCDELGSELVLPPSLEL